jgi:hypothetical protein
MDESSLITVREENGTLRIAWDNPRVRTDKDTSLKPWIICALVTLLFTGLIFVPDADVPMFFRVPFIWCSIIGWLVTIAIPCSWITKTWSEWIEISKNSFSIGKNGFLVLKPWKVESFSLDRVIDLAYGSYNGAGYIGSKVKPSLTLTVVGALPQSTSYSLGFWLAPELTVQVFKTIEQFVNRNHISLEITRYGPFHKTVRTGSMVVRSKPAEINKAYPIEVIEKDDKLLLQWNIRRVCKKNDEVWGLVFILTVWTSFTVLATYAIFWPQPGTYTIIRILTAVWSIGSWGFILFPCTSAGSTVLHRVDRSVRRIPFARLDRFLFWSAKECATGQDLRVWFRCRFDIQVSRFADRILRRVWGASISINWPLYFFRSDEPNFSARHGFRRPEADTTSTGEVWTLTFGTISSRLFSPFSALRSLLVCFRLGRAHLRRCLQIVDHLARSPAQGLAMRAKTDGRRKQLALHPAPQCSPRNP